MTGRFIMGVDGGATKTECAVAAADCRRIALGRGGPSNHEGVGFSAAGSAVRDAVSRALEQARIGAGDVAAACFAMAGMDLPPDRAEIEQYVVLPLGLNCPALICNDAFAGFRAGSPSGVGVCVSLGTGITFCGGNSRGDQLQFERPRPTGIDERIADALIAEYHGLGPACSFRDEYLAVMRMDSLEHFYWSCYSANRPYVPSRAAELVKKAREILFREPHRSDKVVHDLLAAYGEEIADMLVRLADKLELGGAAFDMVLSGSLLTQGRHPALNDAIAARVSARYPNCRPVLPDGPPVDGAVRIAAEMLERAGKQMRESNVEWLPLATSNEGEGRIE